MSLSHKANSEQVDVDGSGAVEWEEFCVLIYKKMREKDSDNEIKEAFRVFDAEGTGLIGECRDGILPSFPQCLKQKRLKVVVGCFMCNRQYWLVVNPVIWGPSQVKKYVLLASNAQM